MYSYQRLFRSSALFVVLAASTWVGPTGCTKPNPNYLGDDGGAVDSRPNDDAGDRDGRLPGDGPIGRDLRRDQPKPVDLGPDGPVVCSKNGDCNDGVPCTTDRCLQNTCEHELKEGFCSIDGVCYKAGDIDPQSACQSCDPNQHKTAWTVAADATPCTDDGLSCTKDVCLAGQCTHELSTGCAINGLCVPEGVPDPANDCQACEPSVATDVYTPLDGEICGATNQGLCIKSACRTPTPLPLTLGGANIERPSLVAVDQQSAFKEIWAGGAYMQQTGPTQQDRGMVVCLSGACASKVQLVSAPIRGLSDRLVVMPKEQLYYGANKVWQPQSALAQALGGAERHGVWGRPLSGVQEVYYLAGQATAGQPGIARCLHGASGNWSCTDQSGFDNNATLVGVFGTLTATGGQGPLWAVTFSDYEHIYEQPGTGTQWSRQAPVGCTDANGQPCYTSFSTDYRDIAGSGASDVWAVGTAGMIMQYDGATWQRASGVMQYQNNYDYDAVYSDAGTGLVIFAAHRDLSFGRYVSLYTYNRKLDRWRGPVTVDKRFDLPAQNAQINDIGGAGVDDLWLVGHRPGSAIGSQEAWALQFK